MSDQRKFERLYRSTFYGLRQAEQAADPGFRGNYRWNMTSYACVLLDIQIDHYLAQPFMRDLGRLRDLKSARDRFVECDRWGTGWQYLGFRNYTGLLKLVEMIENNETLGM